MEKLMLPKNISRLAIVKLMIVLLAFIGLTSPAQAAIKKGAACKKLGATVAVGGLKYSCVKSGKKLVWGGRNKGSCSVISHLEYLSFTK
jgi:hypothetical protein